MLSDERMYGSCFALSGPGVYRREPRPSWVALDQLDILPGCHVPHVGHLVDVEVAVGGGARG
jgi:hypothetical protein